MDPSTAPLIFAEPRLGLTFGVALCAGAALAAAWFLLRPWPPRSVRVAMFGGVLSFCIAAAGGLLRERRVEVNPASRQVTESGGLPVLRSETRWSFEQIGAVAVQADDTWQTPVGPRPSADGWRTRFTLALSTPQGWLALRRFDEVMAAEAQARALAALGPWPARRMGYRLETTARGGDIQAFESPAGRQGVALNLEPMFRLQPAPGEESALTP